MNKNLVLNALNEAYSLLCNEYDTVCDDELASDYDKVITMLKDAIDNISG